MLSPRMRQFLDRLPACSRPSRDLVPAAVPRRRIWWHRLLEATLHFRVTHMRHTPVSSARTRITRFIRIVWLSRRGGCLYFLAYVPEYKDCAPLAGRPHRLGFARQADLHARQPIGRRGVRQLARRQHGAPVACRMAFDPQRRTVRPRARLASVAGRSATPTDGGVVLTMTYATTGRCATGFSAGGARAGGRAAALARISAPTWKAAAAQYRIADGDDYAKPTPLRRPRRPRLVFLGGPSLSASIRTGSGSARSATSRCSRPSFEAKRPSSRSSSSSP